MAKKVIRKTLISGIPCDLTHIKDSEVFSGWEGWFVRHGDYIYGPFETEAQASNFK